MFDLSTEIFCLAEFNLFGYFKFIFTGLIPLAEFFVFNLVLLGGNLFIFI